MDENEMGDKYGVAFLPVLAGRQECDFKCPSLYFIISYPPLVPVVGRRMLRRRMRGLLFWPLLEPKTPLAD